MLEDEESSLKKLSIIQFEREWYVNESRDKIVLEAVNRIERRYK